MAIMLTQELKEFVSRPGVTKILATIGDGGFPNIGPKGSTCVYDDQSLAYAEATGKHHYENIKSNRKVAIAVMDWETREGYRFVGEAQLHTSGAVFDRLVENAQGRYQPLLGVQVLVNEVYALSAGKAGERIL